MENITKEHIGKTFKITPKIIDGFRVPTNEDEIIVDSKGVLLKYYENKGICVLSCKIQYTYLDNIIKDTEVFVDKSQIELL